MTWKKHTRTRWIAFLALLGCSAMIVACRAPDGPVNGDDEAAIRNAILNRQAGQNAGDVKAIYKDVHPDATVFGDSWGPLSKPDSARRAAQFKAGLKLDDASEGVEVNIHGDVAWVTSYIVGTGMRPPADTVAISLRVTDVLVKQDGRWMFVHSHVSPLEKRE